MFDVYFTIYNSQLTLLFIDYFSEHLPEAKTELHYTNAFELTVAVVLSAQCTDKRVNMITLKTLLYKNRDNIHNQDNNPNKNLTNGLIILSYCIANRSTWDKV